jgi:hypothetical protein
MRLVRRILPLVLLVTACMGTNREVLNTALGLGVAGKRRIEKDGCWANCQEGTFCDEESGMCKPIPCGGCRVGLECQITPTGEQCVLPGQGVMPEVPDAGIDAGS